MAKTFKHTNKFWVADMLKGIAEGNQNVTTPHLLRTLEDKGFLAPVSIKKTSGVGRPSKAYELTGKGRGYLGLSKSWKRPAGLIVKASETYKHAA